MGQVTSKKDGTAQGVAKVRHYEALHEPSKRLYHDPYAAAMYPGSIVQAWLGADGTHWLYSVVGFRGLLEMISIRTKWLDNQIVLKAAAQQQLVILGAGYDTRGFRLGDLQQLQGFSVFEIDQPEVQTKKIQCLEQLAKENNNDIAALMGSFVKFAAVDFNNSSPLDEVLRNAQGYSVNKQTIVLMEGVTQYIPKEATMDTLSRLVKVMPAGSTLLITYVDQNCFDEPSKCGPPHVVERIMRTVGATGEDWISGWTRDGFQSFLNELGFEVVSDTTASDYVDEYLVPVNRGLDKEEMLCMERFVVATVKDT